MNTVKAYFEDVAERYQSNSEHGFWSMLRRREAACLVRMLGNLTGYDVLELGCGAGYYTRKILAAGAKHVTALDLSPAMLKMLPPGSVTALCADAASARFDRMFDVIVSAGMLDFAPMPQNIFINAARTAKSGARFVVLCARKGPLGKLYALFHRGHGIRIHVFTPEALQALGEASGWTLTGTNNAGPLALCAVFVKKDAA